MIRFYKYFFYRVYQWQLHWFGEGRDPKGAAASGTAMAITFNVLAALMTFFPKTVRVAVGLEYFLGIGFVILIAVYYYMYRQKKFKEICRSFEKTENSIVFDAISLSLYFVLSAAWALISTINVRTGYFLFQ